MKTRAYPTLVRGGLVFAYLGPAELEPPFPNIEVFDTQPDQRVIYKLIVKGNYFQMLEGDIDSSHVSFLHSRLDGTAFEGSLSRTDMFQDTMPRWSIDETDYGLALTSQRNAGADRYQYRVTQHLFPFVNLIAAPHGERMLANVRVPIDDESSLFYRIFARPRPGTHRRRADADRQRDRLAGDDPRNVPIRREHGERLLDRPQRAAHQDVHRDQVDPGPGPRGRTGPGRPRSPTAAASTSSAPTGRSSPRARSFSRASRR